MKRELFQKNLLKHQSIIVEYALVIATPAVIKTPRPKQLGRSGLISAYTSTS